MESGEESDGSTDNGDADGIVSGDDNNLDWEAGNDPGVGESVDDDGLDWEAGDDPVAGESTDDDGFDWERGDELGADESVDDRMDIIKPLKDYPSVNKDDGDANGGSGADTGGDSVKESITSDDEQQPIVSRINLKQCMLLTCNSSMKPKPNLSPQL